MSGATIREAVRVWSATGLVDVRQGSGPNISERPDTAVAALLATIVGVERSNLPDLLDVAHGLNAAPSSSQRHGQHRRN